VVPVINPKRVHAKTQDRKEELGGEGSLDRHDSPEQPSDYLWCPHCERTYKRGQHRLVNGFEMCPYPDCDGTTVIDAWDWEMFRAKHPDYPVKPERGFKYPLREMPYDDEDDEADPDGDGDDDDDDDLVRMERVHLLAAEIFGYSFEHYAEHLADGNIRFTELMPKDVSILARAEREGWDRARLAKALEIEEDDVERFQTAYRQALEVVDQPDAAKSFRVGVRQAILRALEEEPRDEAWVERLVTQICYRAADLGYLLALEGKRLRDYSLELRKE